MKSRIGYIVITGIVMAVMILLLNLIQYQFLLRNLRLETYLLLVGMIFLLTGVVAARLYMNRKKQRFRTSQFKLRSIEKINLSEREIEILGLIHTGLSNQEIADQLFLSIHTIKSHISSLYTKLDVKRRTQAIQKAKELGIILEE